ncbi:sodium:solute symporter family transporter [Chitinophaga sancti]|uniref:Sodium/solute symporter n=1 Tax=Chitinophaga sancti TaxID=1004 RepID=A0A1K1ND14_9BACT|nr:sodium/solute symporter [Chitinophaga sancti]WQD63309.1 sodium/solute symporter [Chitinophaga sancti]WQG91065.1 sodium/solute symporter [Chitinophaga sancti]SFW33338.1 solute:Na+ symporter, SSS family [Chitinophaga sancti]
MNKLANIDYIIFVVYFLVVASYGYWIYLRKKKATMSTKDFFLAEGSLTWWAIGASLIASNISAEQFIGMSGNGFSVGIAVSAYEWIAAVALIIVAVWFIPVYLKNKIYTMPQFLKTRYNETVALIMAVFWLFLYVFVNLTSILFLGALAINNLVGAEHFHIIMVALAAFALLITLGGMKVIGYTDVIQVVVLIIGGLATTWLALTMVSEHFGLGKDALAGFNALMKDSPDHFEMILKKPGPGASQEYINRYLLLPGITIYFAGQWIINLNYWGCNQYITQRALGADLKTARNGILFAGLMKLMMPVIVMLPGIAAYVLFKNGGLQGEMAPGGQFNADNAYSAVLTFLPNGLKGLSLAALTAAIVASLAGKANSISTIFTLDVYKKYINKEADEKKLVWTGRLTIVVAMLVAIAFTWNDLLGIGGAGGFTFIQKYTGFISPGVFAMFLLGMFWKRTTGAAAVAGIVTGFVLSVVFNNYAAEWFGHETWLYTAFLNSKGVYEIPFQICMGWAFFFTLVVMVALSLAGPKINPKAFHLDKAMFRLAPSTIVLIVMTLLILSALYIRFW